MMYLGLIAAALSAGYFVTSYVRRISARKEEYSAICTLLLHIRGKIYSGGGRLCDIMRGFYSEPLEKNGLLPCLREDPVSSGDGEVTVNNSFFRDKLSDVFFLVDELDAEKLKSYLSSFGKSYLEEEKKKLGEVSEYFGKKESDVVVKSERNIKTAWTLFAFFFIGALILII